MTSPDIKAASETTFDNQPQSNDNRKPDVTSEDSKTNNPANKLGLSFRNILSKKFNNVIKV